MELTDALLVHEAEAAPHWQQPHKLAGLLQQAEQVLSDMRREHDSAADALVSIAVALDSDLDGPHDGGLAPPPQLLLPDVSGRALAPLSLFVGPASPHVVAASPLTAAAPAAQGAVGLEEKVDWLHRGQVESAQSEAHFGSAPLHRAPRSPPLCLACASSTSLVHRPPACRSGHGAHLCKLRWQCCGPATVCGHTRVTAKLAAPILRRRGTRLRFAHGRRHCTRSRFG